MRIKDAFALYNHNEMKILLADVTGRDLSYILTHTDEEINEPELIYSMVERLKNGEPIQYVTGFAYFMDFKLKVNSSVLIPRPETEILIEEILKLGLKDIKILDICTGSGCISRALKEYIKGADITALDVSDSALSLAAINTVGVKLLNMDILKEFPKIYNIDLIVSNPPYIESGEIMRLDKTVKDFEPHIALDGGADGLVFYRRIIDRGYNILKPGGILAFEIGYDQKNKILPLCSRFCDIKVIKDLNKLDRIIIMRKPV